MRRQFFEALENDFNIFISQPSTEAILFGFTGSYDMIDEFLRDVLEAFFKLFESIEDVEFENELNKTISMCKEEEDLSSMGKTLDAYAKLNDPTIMSSKALKQFVLSLGKEEMIQCVRNFLYNVHMDVYIAGDIVDEQEVLEKFALPLQKAFWPKLSSFPNEYHYYQIPLSGSRTFVHPIVHVGKEDMTNEDTNGAICLVSYQFDNFKNAKGRRAAALIYEMLVKQAFFDDLRTAKGLGYIVRADIKDNGYVDSMVFFVSSFTVLNPIIIDQSINKFVEVSRNMIIDITEDQLDQFKSAIRANFTRKQPVSLEDEANADIFFMKEQKVNPFPWNQNEELVEAAAVITKEDLLTFYDNFLAKDGSQVRKLSIHTWPKSVVGEEDIQEIYQSQMPEADLILDKEEFASKVQSFFN